jgi:tRNA (guanosine-2'-O-)-methyltransferase
MSSNSELIGFLRQFVLDGRWEVFQRVLEHRTRYFTFVLEDIFHPHNASAVLRTADCFGIQDVFVIENRFEYRINPNVAMGATKWLDLHRFRDAGADNTSLAIKQLRSKGYRIVATGPRGKADSLYNFDVMAGRCALFFGSEQEGLSQRVLEEADEHVAIPMFGFTESFNISVSAALVAHELVNKLHRSAVDWHLSLHERDELLLRWLKASVRLSDKIMARFHQNIEP